MSQRRSHHTRRQASVDTPRHPPQGPSQIQQAPVIQASDYESDNAGYTSDLPPQHKPQARTNEELNWSVLKRHNPNISSILSIAPFAVIYEFSPSPEPSWDKSGVEGTLFICQVQPGDQLGQDRYTAIVLNRRGLENFEAELREADNTGVEITDPYVIVSLMEDGLQKIFGIFIYSEGPGTSTEHTRTLNAELMKQCAIQAGLSLQSAEAAATEALPPQPNGHAQEQEPAGEDVAMGAPMGQQISLQELFGRQRQEGASWSVRMHNPGGRGQQTEQRFNRTRQVQNGPQQAPAAPQQQNVLLDLFQNAGLGRS